MPSGRSNRSQIGALAQAQEIQAQARARARTQEQEDLQAQGHDHAQDHAQAEAQPPQAPQQEDQEQAQSLQALVIQPTRIVENHLMSNLQILSNNLMKITMIFPSCHFEQEIQMNGIKNT